MKQIVYFILLLAGWGSTRAQVYLPIPVGGFNNDVIADTGTNASIVTTCELDLSNYVLYSAGFAATNNIQGGILNSGTIVNNNRTYQLGDYTSYNGLYLSAGGHVRNSSTSGSLMFGTPGMYSRISLLLFSTEGNSQLGIVLKFTDGTIVNAGTHDVLDWFWGAGAVYAGCGRIDRKTAATYIPDGLPTEPRFYPLDIFVDCANQSKYLEMVYVNFLGGSDTSTRAVVLAVSGVLFSPVAVTAAVTSATCGAADGSIMVDATGGTMPLSYTWNTNPAQTTPALSNIPGGNYTCTITDSNQCVTTWQGTVTKTSPLTVSASTNTTEICKGEYAVLSASALGGTAASYTWMPGNITGGMVTVSPADTTTYTVKATDAFGCTASATVAVAVKPSPVADFTVVPTTVCLNNEQTVRFTGKAGATASYDWNNFAGATVKNGVGAGPYTILFNQAGNYKLQLKVTDKSCVSAIAEQLVEVKDALSAPVITVTAVTNNSITFSWDAVNGATGYQVSIDGVLVASSITATSYTVTSLPPLKDVSISVKTLGLLSCQNSALAKGAGKTLAGQYFIPNSFTPNGDGLNDVFKVYGNIVADVKMKVFNQWGELLCESKGLANGWDGRQKGKIQPVGVYTYVILLTFTDGTLLTKKGFVHLIH